MEKIFSALAKLANKHMAEDNEIFTSNDIKNVAALAVFFLAFGIFICWLFNEVLK